MAKPLQVTYAGASSPEATLSLCVHESAEAVVLALVTPHVGPEKNDRVFRIVQERMDRAFHELPLDNPRRFLTRALGNLNAALFSVGSGDPESERLMASIACVFVTGGQVTWAHIGDARIYLLRDGLIKAVTHDHTQAQQMVDQALLKPEEARDHPLAQVRLRILGKKPIIDVPTQGPVPAKKGDHYILCSAAMVQTIDDHTIGNSIIEGDLSLATNDLCRKAESIDEKADDILAIQAIRFGDPPRKKVVAYNPLDNIARSLMMSRKGNDERGGISNRGWWIRGILGAALLIYILLFLIFDPHFGSSPVPDSGGAVVAPAAEGAQEPPEETAGTTKKPSSKSETKSQSEGPP